MQITRTSTISGKINTREINVTEGQILLWEAGALIQDAMPKVSAGDRGFIKTGVTPEEWEEVFGK